MFRSIVSASLIMAPKQKRAVASKVTKSSAAISKAKPAVKAKAAKAVVEKVEGSVYSIDRW